MKVGRNDPCPCGSGKKYKKCCLLQVQQQAITARKAQQATVTTTKPTITSSERLAGSPDHTTAVEAANAPVSAIDRCWDQFEASDYEERIRLFLQTLDEPDVMDDEMAFDMLTDLSGASIKRNERARLRPCWTPCKIACLASMRNLRMNIWPGHRQCPRARAP